jgi:hypothetical protein
MKRFMLLLLRQSALWFSWENINAWNGGNTSIFVAMSEETKQTNSMVCVRERTIPTEQPPLVGEVIASFCG